MFAELCYSLCLRGINYKWRSFSLATFSKFWSFYLRIIYEFFYFVTLSAAAVILGIYADLILVSLLVNYQGNSFDLPCCSLTVDWRPVWNFVPNWDVTFLMPKQRTDLFFASKSGGAEFHDLGCRTPRSLLMGRKSNNFPDFCIFISVFFSARELIYYNDPGT